MNEEFEVLKRMMIEKLGFFPERYKKRPLKRRIAVRMRYNRINSYLEYAKLLERDTKEQRLLHKTLTINVSKFFRNYETFGKIEEVVLPQILRENERKGGLIKVWCAGCATGQESYTIAMLLDKFLSERQSSAQFSVIGTDIDNDSLNTARIGCYRNEVFDETPEYFLNMYFKKDEKICVLDKIKEKVRFVRFDIEEENIELKELDLVLFRNVLIYMEKTFQEKILSMIYNRLNEKAFLVLGKVEYLVGEAKSLFNTVDSRERIYRKC
ncbi:MAG: protein-glutamate O-methyltransferase CheR [Candidatus Cloacimonadota bacterium]|nr:MAG: protein-glutamate O-methyltransferase CheR [Candidatus Cloacimonadota bacterium]